MIKKFEEFGKEPENINEEHHLVTKEDKINYIINNINDMDLLGEFLSSLDEKYITILYTLAEDFIEETL